MRFKKAYDEFGDNLYKEWLGLSKSAKSLSFALTFGAMLTISNYTYHAIAFYLVFYFWLVALLLAAVRQKDKFIMKCADKLESLLHKKQFKIQRNGGLKT